MKKIVSIVGARPQFIKHAPVEIELSKDFELKSIHSGQHYDERMSKVFFEQLKIKKPDYNLNIGSSDHASQTGRMLIEIGPILEQESPAAVLVYGDTNTTLAGALSAAKLNIPIIHVEAGLRSYNRLMPEEINRVLTDHLSSILICPTRQSVENLKNEGIITGVFESGDVMKDMIMLAFDKGILVQEKIEQEYYFATIHRPYNTDDDIRLMKIIRTLDSLDAPVKFSVHPRTANRLKQKSNNLFEFRNIEFLEPVSYFECLNLQYNSKAVITDSGGIQKEAYLLKKQCITIRTETEWVETLNGGWNTLVYDNLNDFDKIISNKPGQYNEDVYGTGSCSKKINAILKEYLT